MIKKFMISLIFSSLATSAGIAENYQVPKKTILKISQTLGQTVVASLRQPRKSSIQIVSEGGESFVRVTVKDGDIGGAPTDNDPTHSKSFDKPYSERSEVRMKGTMKRNSVYEITFDARFIEGFQGHAETFFQIHTGKKPPLMFFFREFGNTHLQAILMQGCSRSCGHNDHPKYDKHKKIYPRADMFGRWHEFRIVVDTSNRGEMSIFFNGATLVKNQPVTFPSRHNPYVRLGIYRAGNLSGNTTSVVEYRSLDINRIGAAR